MFTYFITTAAKGVFNKVTLHFYVVILVFRAARFHRFTLKENLQMMTVQVNV